MKSDVESKKREIIEASDLINRVTCEIDEVRKENSDLKKSVDKFDKERFNLNSKLKKLERAMYKSNCEQKKLTSVIQMQKDSLNDIQKDYFSSHELEYNEAMKTYENIPPLLDITNQNGSTVVYNNKHRSRFMVQKNNTQNLMHSFDNILTPLETKTHYDQLSPFSSAKTLNKLGNTVQKSARKHNDTIICNRLANDVSESHRTFKERSVEKVATQNTFPHKNHQRCSSKNSVHSFKNNVSRSSSKLGSSIQSSS